MRTIPAPPKPTAAKVASPRAKHGRHEQAPSLGWSLGVERAAGFTHEAVVGIAVCIRHKAQALAGEIDLAQGGPYGFAISEDRRISRAEDTGEPVISGAGPKRAHHHQAAFAHTCTVKIKRAQPRERGRQKSGMPPEAEANHMDGTGSSKPAAS